MKKERPKVSLKEAVDNFETISDMMEVYYNVNTGKFDCYSNYDPELFGDPKRFKKKEWIPLPCLFDLRGFDTMVQFYETVTDPRARELLGVALNGKGAFRRFKDVVHSLDLTEKWYAFKNQSLVSSARHWCEEKGLEYVDDTAQ